MMFRRRRKGNSCRLAILLVSQSVGAVELCSRRGGMGAHQLIVMASSCQDAGVVLSTNMNTVEASPAVVELCSHGGDGGLFLDLERQCVDPMVTTSFTVCPTVLYLLGLPGLTEERDVTRLVCGARDLDMSNTGLFGRQRIHVF